MKLTVHEYQSKENIFMSISKIYTYLKNITMLKSKPFILTNLFLFLSLITVGQIYKAQKRITPGTTYKSMVAGKSVNGKLYFFDFKTLHKYENGVLTKYPECPKINLGDTILFTDIEEFNGNIYISSQYSFMFGSDSCNIIYFDGVKWEPLGAIKNKTKPVYNLCKTRLYLYTLDNQRNLTKIDTNQNAKVIRTNISPYSRMVTYQRNEIIFNDLNYIFKYNGTHFDSVKSKQGMAIGNVIEAGDTDVYFNDNKYLCKIDKTFAIQKIDTFPNEFQALLGILDSNVLHQSYISSQLVYKAYNPATKTTQNVIGLQTGEYTEISHGKMYILYARYGENSKLYEIEDGIFISGSVYDDLNKNCTKNTGENPTEQLKINFKDSVNSFLTMANDTGYYQMVVTPGKYNVNVEKKYTTTKYDTCGGNKSFNMGTAYTANIPFTVTPNIKDIGASIVGGSGFVARRGFTQTYQINYENFGTTTQNYTIELEYPDSVTFKSSSISPVSHSGSKLTFALSNINKFEKGKISLEFEVHSKKPLNSIIKFVCNTLSPSGDADTTNNTDTLEQRIVAAIDPNLKQSFPEGVIEKPVSKIRYHIHFQNEGNYYATKVTVVDTFDSKMPLIKLQMLGAKHPYTLRVEKGNVIIWEFDNINLVPKSDSEEGSKGFISFEAPLSRPMAIGDKIQNRAHIYFDYEDAITTPFAIVSMGKDPVSVKPVFDATHKIKVYPNPTSNGFSISGETRLGEIAIFNTLGELVYMANTTNTSQNINTESWATGIYFIRFLDKGLGIKVIKL